MVTSLTGGGCEQENHLKANGKTAHLIAQLAHHYGLYALATLRTGATCRLEFHCSSPQDAPAPVPAPAPKKVAAKARRPTVSKVAPTPAPAPADVDELDDEDEMRMGGTPVAAKKSKALVDRKSVV